MNITGKEADRCAASLSGADDQTWSLQSTALVRKFDAAEEEKKEDHAVGPPVDTSLW